MTTKNEQEPYNDFPRIYKVDPRSRPIQEDRKTIRARQKISKILQELNYSSIIGEKVWNNLIDETGQVINPPYQTDLVCCKIFCLELDPPQIHGSKIKRGKDKRKDVLIRQNMEILTVRLDPRDVLKLSTTELINEIEYQLMSKK